MHDPRASTSQPPERGSLPTRTARNVTFHPCSKEDGCTFKTGSDCACIVRPLSQQTIERRKPGKVIEVDPCTAPGHIFLILRQSGWLSSDIIYKVQAEQFRLYTVF